MLRFAAILMAGALVLAAGCKSQPAPPPEGPPTPPPDTHITTIEPRNMAEELTLTPAFKWKLPSTVGSPQLVSFSLFELGQAAEPPKPTDEGKQIAFASGLHDVSPTALDPFHPPPGCVLTGGLTDMKQLKGNTWYRWHIRAMGSGPVVQADFYFRTRAGETTPSR